MIIVMIRIDLRFLWAAVASFVKRRPMVLRIPQQLPYGDEGKLQPENPVANGRHTVVH
jgi:hypothetical protein